MPTPHPCRVRLATLFACVLSLTGATTAEGAFTLSINGTQVAVDNGAGDRAGSAGQIRYTGTIDGYQIRLTSGMTPGSSLAFTELQVWNTAGRGEHGAPLVVTLSHQAGFAGSADMTATLARSGTSAFDASGGACSSIAWQCLSGGGTGKLCDLALAGSAESALGRESVEWSAGEYLLSQTITVDGLRSGKKVVVTAGGKDEGGGGDNGGGGPQLQDPVVPAPSSLTLLAVGVALAGAYRWRASRRLSPAA